MLQGAFTISNQSHGKYLDASAGDSGWVRDAALGLQGPDFLNSAAPRTQIWLIEKATDGKNFRFRNYETGGALDDQSGNISLTTNNGASQVWEVTWRMGNDLGAVYQIKNALTSNILTGSRNRYNRWGEFTYREAFVIASQPCNDTTQDWLIKPILLPTLYWLTNSAVPALFLHMASRPSALDNTSREVALVPKDLSARNQLWKFEYTSDSECILRNASDDQFVLDLSVEDLRTLLARKRHGRPNQCWVVKDEDENNHIVSLANVKTNTLLATRERKLLGASALNTLAVLIKGNTRWQLLPNPRPPFFWVTIQNARSGAFLTRAEDGSIVPSMGALHANDHSVQWRFIMLNQDLQYVIVNRATGFMLQYYPGTTSEVSVVAENNKRNDVNSHWMLDSPGNTNFGVVNVGSKCVLDHYHGETIQACDPGAGYNYSNRQWIIMPFYDNVPSFALVNSHTGQCIANNPEADVGTATTTDDINDYKSQWLFYHPANNLEPDPEYVLLNKMSGHVLEHYEGTLIEAHDVCYMDPQQRWKLLPLRGRGFSLVNTATQQFLHSPSESSAEGVQTWSWHLVSFRESEFDFISWDFDILQRLLAHLSPQAAQELQRVIERRLPADEKKMKGEDKATHIPRATRVTRITNDKIRTILTQLIGQWEGDSIPKTSQPHTIASIDRKTVENWGISLSERPLRRRSDEPGWIRIDLQGVYDVSDSWLANIEGHWLEASMFQIIIPVGLHIGRAVIRRAMLQSVVQGLTVEVRAASPMHTPSAGRQGSPGAISRPRDLGADDGKMNSLTRMMNSIKASSLGHDELQD